MAASISGERFSGEGIRSANVTAIMALSNALRSSLGPQGLDKMMVDDIGDVTITNDGATILKQLEVQHPAAKVLVDLSQLQDQEVGDGTTSVVLLAAELLRHANELVKMSIHPTSVIAGYKLAAKECVRYIEANLTAKVDALGRDVLRSVAKTSLSSKYIGTEDELFSGIVVDAIAAVKKVNDKGEVRYPVGAVNVCKTQGRSIKESRLIPGYCIRATRAAQGMPMIVKNAKIALVDFNLRQHRMQLGVQVDVSDPAELEKIRLKEKDVTKDKISKILASGANVILTSQGIDDMAMKYFVEAKAIAVRRVEPKDMRRIASLTGGRVVLTMATLDGDEKFDASALGTAGEVAEEMVGDWGYLFFRNCKGSKAASILLRGPNENALDEIDRSVHDALCAVSRALEKNAVCAGGGAVETALAIYLEDFARTLGSREQLAIASFASALQIIPKTLAVNASLDAADLLSRLRMLHAKSQTAPPLDSPATSSPSPSEEGGGRGGDSSTVTAGAAGGGGGSATGGGGGAVVGGDVAAAASPAEYKWFGLDLMKGELRNNLTAGVLEAALGKIKSIRFATEAAVTILRIDDLIKVAPEPEAPPQPQ